MKKYLADFWELLIIIAVLGAIVAVIAPKNLQILPYKLLIVCLSVYVANKIDLVFWGEPDKDDAIPRAIVYAATVMALALAL